LQYQFFLLSNSISFAINAEHQGTNLEFTVVQTLHQGTSAKRGVIVWRAPFLFLFWRSKKEKKLAASDRKNCLNRS
jgi:hypothetical protein